MVVSWACLQEIIHTISKLLIIDLTSICFFILVHTNIEMKKDPLETE